MAAFLMFGKYTAEALKGMSSERTDEVVDLIGKLGGKVSSMYAVLGEYDLVLITDFSDLAEAMKASVALNKLTAISFTTTPAVPVAEFDKLMADL